MAPDFRRTTPRRHRISPESPGPCSHRTLRCRFWPRRGRSWRRNREEHWHRRRARFVDWLGQENRARSGQFSAWVNHHESTVLKSFQSWSSWRNLPARGARRRAKRRLDVELIFWRRGAGAVARPGTDMFVTRARGGRGECEGTGGPLMSIVGDG